MVPSSDVGGRISTTSIQPPATRCQVYKALFERPLSVSERSGHGTAIHAIKWLRESRFVLHIIYMELNTGGAIDGWIGLKSTPVTIASGCLSAKSIVHIPLPVPASITQRLVMLHSLQIGVRLSGLLKSKRDLSGIFSIR